MLPAVSSRLAIVLLASPVAVGAQDTRRPDAAAADSDRPDAGRAAGCGSPRDRPWLRTGRDRDRPARAPGIAGWAWTTWPPVRRRVMTTGRLARRLASGRRSLRAGRPRTQFLVGAYFSSGLGPTYPELRLRSGHDSARVDANVTRRDSRLGRRKLGVAVRRDGRGYHHADYGNWLAGSSFICGTTSWSRVRASSRTTRSGPASCSTTRTGNAPNGPSARCSSSTCTTRSGSSTSSHRTCRWTWRAGSSTSRTPSWRTGTSA